MRAVICHGPENYQLEEVAVPKPGPGEALIRVEATGICASDLKCYHGAAKFWGDSTRPAWAETEVIPGHEFVGKVVQLDDKAADRWGIALGDRVVAEQIVPCWKCRYCVNGEYWMCAPHDMFGFKRRTPGGMAEYMVYNKDALVYKISPDLPPAHAAFTEPLSCALHAVERGEIKFEDTVVVAGCGPIGLGMIAGAKSKNPKTVVALDMAQDKLDIAKECGADVIINIGQEDAVAMVKEMTDGYGADVYLEGTGHPSAVAKASTSFASWARMSSTAYSVATSRWIGRSSATTRNSTYAAPTSAQTAGRQLSACSSQVGSPLSGSARINCRLPTFRKVWTWSPVVRNRSRSR